MSVQPRRSLYRRFRSFAASLFPGLRRLSKLEHRLRVMGKPTAQVFQEIYDRKMWGSEGSVSGQGSSLAETEAVRAALPALIGELGIKSMLDAPCGDFHWMNTVDFDVDYIGGDIVPDLVTRNQAQYANARRRFTWVDLTADVLPKVDLVFCRDCLPHLAASEIRKAIANIRRSGAKYLLTTTFERNTDNPDIPTGMFRAINLELPPFSLGKPLRLIDERCPTPGYGDKRLGLWRVSDLPEL